MLAAVEAVNDAQKRVLFRKIERHYGGKLAGKAIAIWGLAFKPNTEDMREAPSRVLMEALWAAGATVRAYDPVAMDEARRIYGNRHDLTLCKNAAHALEGADALAICTEWQEFRSPDLEKIKGSLEGAGRVRRPQSLRSGADGRPGNPLLRDRQGRAAAGVGRTPLLK